MYHFRRCWSVDLSVSLLRHQRAKDSFHRQYNKMFFLGLKFTFFFHDQYRQIYVLCQRMFPLGIYIFANTNGWLFFLTVEVLYWRFCFLLSFVFSCSNRFSFESFISYIKETPRVGQETRKVLIHIHQDQSSSVHIQSSPNFFDPKNGGNI